MPHIHSLTLTAFRNYETALIKGVDDPFVILVGDNGAGKTNCLEAISLLSPGRGLRGASVPDMRSHGVDTPWSVFCEISDGDDDVTRLGVGQDANHPKKKNSRYNGAPVKNQDELGDILRTLWLTPQMDGLFLQRTSEKLRFFDRLVAAFDPAHAGRMKRYEKATRERLALLKAEPENSHRVDTVWLTSLENIMAETSVAIAAARIDILERLSHAIRDYPHDSFPQASLSIQGDVEDALQNSSAIYVEDMVAHKLNHFRQGDGQSGRTNFGIGRSNFQAIYEDKNMPAAQCSTGEQKALLTTVILAHARMIQSRYGEAPILLFDEVGAHFDTGRRDALFHILSDLDSQIWLSGQDEKMFSAIPAKRIVHVADNQLL